MTTVYGIKNCDTVKKARKWLESQGIEYHFHDYRVDGLNVDQLNAWIAELGWEAMLNKRSTTWRQLDQDIKDNLDQATATQVMIDNPTIIKRPLLDTGDTRLLGFKDTQYAEALR
ncbi:MAG: ArsC family reductase [Pontibacterium sp.]